MNRIVSFSAPGKVMLTGSYIILEPNYSGLICSVNSRIKTNISPLLDAEKDERICRISNLQYEYNDDLIIDNFKENNKEFEKKRPLLYNCLNMIFSFIENIVNFKIEPIEIEICSDESFRINGQKTGLGSSSALVVSLVGCMLKYHDIQITPDQFFKLCYYIHSICQNKVGSGFDISTAIFGSQRFEKRSTPKFNDDSLFNIINDPIEYYKFNRFKLPPFLQISLGNISIGYTKTNDMIKEVTEWGDGNEKQKTSIYQELNEKNNNIYNNFMRLNSIYLEDQNQYVNDILSFLDNKNDKSNVSILINELKDNFYEIREKLFILGEYSGTPIEPEEISPLIDETMKLDECIFCGIPGAGGYDSIFSVYIDCDCISSIHNVWDKYDVDPIYLKEDPEGVKVEILGLDNAGKTTIVNRFNGEDINKISPTLGFNIKTLEYKNYKLNIWDVGGQKSLRTYWRNYFEETDGLIWVVDSADIFRLNDCKKELLELLKEEKLAGASLLIFANKQDLKKSLDPKEIEKKLELSKIKKRHWNIEKCSAFTGEGLEKGIEWIVQDISNRIFLLD